MCHRDGLSSFGEIRDHSDFHAAVSGIHFPGDGAQIAVMPDIYGLTDFYKGYASYLAGRGADVYLTNPWHEFGDLAEATREAAYERRHKLRDREHCDRLERFLSDKAIDTFVGFCIGGNFAFELARRGFGGTNVAIYPLPWGMPNPDQLTPAFDYLPELDRDVTIIMGAADHLAGAENIARLETQARANPRLTLHLYPGSDHGFFKDIAGEDEALRTNAEDAMSKVDRLLFAD